MRLLRGYNIVVYQPNYYYTAVLWRSRKRRVDVGKIILYYYRDNIMLSPWKPHHAGRLFNNVLASAADTDRESEKSNGNKSQHYNNYCLTVSCEP